MTSSAASSIRSVHWGKKKISKAWTCDEVFLPEAYSPCLVPLFLMVPYSHKLQAESVRGRRIIFLLFPRRHAHLVTFAASYLHRFNQQ